ncbi:MAG: thioredoxin domain-containing protein [Planctomycetota bacterium]|nr:thioredoxin domain-containing protein [Planctomycetota bacterium]
MNSTTKRYDHSAARLRLVACSLVAGFFFSLVSACRSDDAPAAAKDGADASAKASDPQGKSAKANHLSAETSPYLLMHAHNPVDWYPWGPEAFAKAKEENKPIFLSIGYSSCYWCHVMERESFMDAEIAAFLNQHFVCIKVDREERPDVDDIYMTATQVLTGRGGWPLTVFMTPEGLPFLGGTYFPARQGDRGERIGFLELITRIASLWKEKPEPLLEQSRRLTAAVQQVLREERKEQAQTPNTSQVERVKESMRKQFDPTYGGFGSPPFPRHQPKFPNPPELLFLADRMSRTKDRDAENMLTLTLDKMAEGGIRDHLGGGFHRYSVDRHWQIPHFEKMLYDNAQLASVYAEAYSVTKNPTYRRVAEEMLDFVLREMRDPQGGFYTAIDAETDAEEGKFYRWEKEELQAQLDPESFAWLAPLYSFSGPPNFEHDGHAYYVLQLPDSLDRLAAEQNITTEKLADKMRPLRERLLEARSERKRPLTDPKILTAWNGLMIRGFADAGRIFGVPRYLEAAEQAADFVLEKLQQPDGRMIRTYRDGTAKLNGYLVDYAFLVDGLIALHRATGNPRWLQEARRLTDRQIDLFWDEKDSGFFFTSDDHETLIARAKKQTDSVLPSGNGISALNLIYLAEKFPDQP